MALKCQRSLDSYESNDETKNVILCNMAGKQNLLPVIENEDIGV